MCDEARVNKYWSKGQNLLMKPMWKVSVTGFPRTWRKMKLCEMNLARTPSQSIWQNLCVNILFKGKSAHLWNSVLGALGCTRETVSQESLLRFLRWAISTFNSYKSRKGSYTLDPTKVETTKPLDWWILNHSQNMTPQIGMCRTMQHFKSMKKKTKQKCHRCVDFSISFEQTGYFGWK